MTIEASKPLKRLNFFARIAKSHTFVGVNLNSV